MHDYVVDSTRQAKFGGDRFGIFAPQIFDFHVIEGVTIL